MDASETKNFRRILIASANPLFGQGLLKLIRGRWGSQRTQVRLIDSNAQLIDCMQSWQPDLVIVDYDDKTISRAEFLQKFISDDFPVQVMLVSLQASGQVTVYDRRTLTRRK
jgi:cytochrome c oxidase subunit 2